MTCRIAEGKGILVEAAVSVACSMARGDFRKLVEAGVVAQRVKWPPAMLASRMSACSICNPAPC